MRQMLRETAGEPGAKAAVWSRTVGFPVAQPGVVEEALMGEH